MTMTETDTPTIPGTETPATGNKRKYTPRAARALATDIVDVDTQKRVRLGDNIPDSVTQFKVAVNNDPASDGFGTITLVPVVAISLAELNALRNGNGHAATPVGQGF